MNEGMPPRRRRWVGCALLVGFGLAGSGYLLARVFAMLASPGPLTPDMCSALFATSCDGAVADERFWFLGVPLAGWGLVYFASVGGLLLLAGFMRRAFEDEALLAASLLTLAGTGVGLALSGAAILGRAPICPLCLMLHAASLLLLVALQRAGARSLREQLALLTAAAEWLLRPAGGTPEPARWRLVGFFGVALLAAVAYQWVYVESALRRPRAARPPDRAQVIAAFRASPRLALPVAERDPHLGPLGAPVQLVVFESFRCPGCRPLAATLARLHRRFRDRLVVVYKHYPLSTQCNERLKSDMQPGACEVAWAAEAAHRQERFWPFHDALFAAGPRPAPEAVATAVRGLDLDPARFESDRRSDAVRGRVAEDIALGNRLKIPGTPAAFLDGRLVQPARAEILEILILNLLERRAAESKPRDPAAAGRGRPQHEGRPM